MAPEVSNSPNAWMFRSGCGASKLTKKTSFGFDRGIQWLPK